MKASVTLWEYAHVRFDIKRAVQEKKLLSNLMTENWGAKGWECLQVTYEGPTEKAPGGTMICTFKRPIDKRLPKMEALDEREKKLDEREKSLNAREEIIAKREQGLVEVGPVRIRRDQEG